MAQSNPASVRYERTEVAATPSVHQVEASVVDPYAPRRAGMYKLQQGLYLLFGLIEALLGIRFVLRLLGAEAAAPFVGFVYGVTAPLVAPFVGIFGTVQANGNVLEPHSLVGLVVYPLLAWLLIKLAWLLFGETREGLTSTTRTTKTRVV
ncbi:MAG: YggT family protein [Chloroflexi bacterium]|nr:YggT family protein [Chloroflexota bacterium]